MALTIGELVGYLDLDDTGWGRKNKQAHDDMRSMRDDLDKTSAVTNKLALDFLNLANNLSNIPTAVAALTGTATILANLSGALGVIPAAGAAAVTAIATLKIGMSGFGDALKNVGDPQKFAESLKTLSPNAQAAAKAIRDLVPAWTELKKSVQDELFSGVAKTIKQVGGTYMPILKGGLKDVAAGFDEASYGVRAFFMQAQTQKDVNAIFGGTSGVVASLSSALQPALEILRDIVAVGMEFLPVGDGFGNAARRAADFVHQARETGQLHAWISKGLSTIGDLATLFKQLGQIVGTVFGGLNAGGTNMLQTLIKVTAQVRDFLRSFEGQQALKAVGQALNAVSTVVTQVMLTAFRELAPVIVKLAPGFAELARQVGSVLVDALEIAGPLLQLLAGFISDNIDWLGPLAIALYGGVQAFQAVTGAIKILNVISSLNPWVIIIAATITLVTLIVVYWDQIVAAVKTAIDWVVNFVRDNWQLLISIILGPLGVIIALVVTYWSDIVSFIGNAVDTIARWVRDRIQDVLNFVSWLGQLPGRVAAWFGQLKDSAIQRLAELIDWLRGLPGRVLAAIGNLGELLVEAGKDLIRGLWRGIESMVGWLKDRVASVGNIVSNAFSRVLGIFSPSRVMADLGRMIPLGVAVGIEAGMPALDRAIAGMAARSMIGMDTPDLASPAGGPAPFAVAGDQRSLVHIDTFNATVEQTPADIARDLDWASRGAGY